MAYKQKINPRTGKFNLVTNDGGSGSGYEPDQEDITLNSESKLQLKNRAATDSSMGYVILRKNKSFASQVTQTNTIYEIRYAFDLAGATVTIPEGCTLKFEGGLLSNGKLRGNKYYIDSKSYCLDTITFTEIGYTSVYNMRWSIPESYYRKSIESLDSSDLIMNIFENGYSVFDFDGLSLYVAKTITIEKLISIKSVSKRTGSIKSDDVYTIIDYHCRATSGSPRVRLEDLSLSTSVFVEDEERAILNISNDGTNGIWGFSVKCSIYGALNSVDRRKSEHTQKNIGIRISAQTSYITYIDISGVIENVGNILKIPSNRTIASNAWITNTTINIEGVSVKGCECDDGNPVIINGSYQPLYSYETIDNGYGFFYGDDIYLNGYIWDLNTGNNTNGFTCQYPFRAINQKALVHSNFSESQTNASKVDFYDKGGIMRVDSLVGRKNLLYNAWRNSQFYDAGQNVISFDVRIGGKSIYNDETVWSNIENPHLLVPLSIPSYQGSTKLDMDSKNDVALVTGTNVNKSLEYEMNISLTGNMLLLYKTLSGSATVEVYKADSLIYSCSNTIYYPYQLGVLKLDTDIYGKWAKLKVIVRYSTITTNIPQIALVSKEPSFATYRPPILPFKPTVSTTSGSSASTFANEAIEYIWEYDKKIYRIHNTSKYGYSICHGESGLPIGIKHRGTTAQRPTLKSTHIDYLYFDETIGKYIIWNGTEWKDITTVTPTLTTGTKIAEVNGTEIFAPAAPTSSKETIVIRNIGGVITKVSGPSKYSLLELHEQYGVKRYDWPDSANYHLLIDGFNNDLSKYEDFVFTHKISITYTYDNSTVYPDAKIRQLKDSAILAHNAIAARRIQTGIDSDSNPTYLNFLAIELDGSLVHEENTLIYIEIEEFTGLVS